MKENKTWSSHILLCPALQFHWPIRQLDISNAFLHGVLEEEVYMAQPQGFINSQFPHHVCKLKKALYGLKQAPRAWYSTFFSFLISQGFHNSHSNSLLFIKKSQSCITVLLIYVDDILLTGSDSSIIANLVHNMHEVFSMKELGPVSYFLGVFVQHHASGFFLSQHKYASDLLVKAGMVNCKPCVTYVALKPSFSPGDTLSFTQLELYRSVVGALLYLTITRPDLSFAVNQACQHIHSPTVAHFAVVKKILKYVKGTLAHGLTFNPGPFTLHAYTDSNWSAKKQPTVSRSSTEAEYRSMVNTAAELCWLQQLLADLSISLSSVPLLWCDNISTMSLASNPIFHSRSKHIEIDCHFIRERVAFMKIDLRYIPTTDQLTGLFTKALTSSRFHYLTNKL
ncbi:uncharacterized protein LOC114280929 [Camellia sinensis]|uniref:uncharacterized protein LOC114280929 n=1 Tax=Camellia sinensis TaxID=4442 RepID=UPI001036B85B|nr:uncharacterized protein LOC114280929 [Camellia sinensis]